MTQGPAHDAGGGWVPRVRRPGRPGYQPVHDAEVRPAHLRDRGAAAPAFIPLSSRPRSWRRLASLLTLGGVGAVVVVLLASGVLGEESPRNRGSLSTLAGDGALPAAGVLPEASPDLTASPDADTTTATSKSRARGTSSAAPKAAASARSASPATPAAAAPPAVAS